MTYKYSIGQKVVVVTRGNPLWEKRVGILKGKVFTVVNRGVDQRGIAFYNLSGLPQNLKFSRVSLRPIDDPKFDSELGSWDEITKLLGKDIRTLEVAK